MRQETITTSLIKRLGQRSNWLAVILLGGTFFLLHLLGGRPSSVADHAMPFVLLVCHLVLAPIPWQFNWKRQSRMPIGWRYVQVLLFNLAWVAAVLWIVHALSLPQPRRPWPPPSDLPPFPRDRPLLPPIPMLPVDVLNVALASVFGWFYTEKEAAERRAHRMVSLFRQAQSRALQSQLRPHVLFNALNSLSELVYEDPLAAEEVIARLADLYRMLMVHSESEFVRLGEERSLVEAYLSMEQMRLGERLQIQWEWPPDCDALKIPPLLLQPLVENAIKHGISPSDQGGIVRISMQSEDGRCRLRVSNTGCRLEAGADGGVGLRNLRARLELWSGAAAHFDLVRDGEWTVATLQWTQGRGA